MTFEDFLISLNATAADLSDKTVRLLLHLVATAITQGTYTITASDLDISRAAGIGHGRIGEAKRQLAGIMAVETRRGCASTFKLPSTWFPLQQSLFSVRSDPKTGSLVTPLRGLGQPQNGATGDPVTGLSDPGTGLLQPQNGATVTPKWGQVTPERGYSDPGTGSPHTQNQQDTEVPSSIESSSVLTSEMKEYVFSILSKRYLPSELRPSALALGAEMQHYMHQHGNVETAQNLPDDRVLAQCLSIAPLRELLPALSAAKPRRGRPTNYAWFVSVFLENLKGIDRDQTKLIRQEWREVRQSKPPGRAETLPFPDLMTRQAANQVKTLR